MNVHWATLAVSNNHDMLHNWLKIWSALLIVSKFTILKFKAIFDDYKNQLTIIWKEMIKQEMSISNENYYL